MNMHAKLPRLDAMPLEEAVGVAPAAAAPRRRWLPWVIAAIVAVAALAIGWRVLAPKPVVAPGAAPTPSVTVIVPGAAAVADRVTATGAIAARRDAAVGVEGEGGLVTQVLVDAGDFVRRGQVLARIDRSVATQQAAQMAAGIKQAEADAALAASELARAQKLVEKGFISRADIDRREATLAANRARVAVARAQLGEMNARIRRLDIRAPASGLVLARSVEAGQVVGAGSPALFRVAEGGTLEMRALVAEQDMARLRVGMPAAVRPSGSTTDYRGSIWLLDPVIDAASRQGVARIALPYSPGLRVGAFGSATVAVGEATLPVLPQSAVQVDSTGSFVYIVDAAGVVQRRGVTTGEVGATGVSIVKGLDGSERVVATAGAFLRPGDKVRAEVARATRS